MRQGCGAAGSQSWHEHRISSARSTASSTTSSSARSWPGRKVGGTSFEAAGYTFLARTSPLPASRHKLLNLLSSRFNEVIVDEVQDCSAEDVALLQLLLEAGTRLVLVGDPEQAIY